MRSLELNIENSATNETYTFPTARKEWFGANSPLNMSNWRVTNATV